MFSNRRFRAPARHIACVIGLSMALIWNLWQLPFLEMSPHQQFWRGAALSQLMASRLRPCPMALFQTCRVYCWMRTHTRNFAFSFDVRNARAVVLEHETKSLLRALREREQACRPASAVLQGVARDLARGRHDLGLIDERKRLH